MTPLLEVRDLTFAFDGRRVLDAVTFSLTAGERVGIAGANGAGKTTLLWCVLGLLCPEGQVRVCGHPLSRATGGVIAAVFQNPDDQLFMPRLVDDLTLPLLNRGVPSQEATRRATGTLAAFDLLPVAERPASKLSLGERKRAALAAALVLRPELVVLDEPTAELDGRAVRRLVDMLNDLSVALLVASHDLMFLRATTARLIVMREGRIFADAATAEVIEDRALLEYAGLV